MKAPRLSPLGLLLGDRDGRRCQVDSVWGAACLIVGCVAAVMATQQAHVAAIIIAPLVALTILMKLDSWQRVYLITLALLFAASSNQAALAEIAFYTRYIAAGALVAYTWRSPKEHATLLAQLARPARLLIYGMWTAVLVAIMSIAWSVDRMLTAQQAIALVFLAATIHGLLTRRWQERQRIVEDFMVAFWFFTAIFIASLLAYWGGLPNTSTTLTFRLQGLFANPNTLATTCALILAIGWGLFRERRQTRYLIALLPCLLALLLTGTQTALFAVVVAGVWLAARKGPAGAAASGVLSILGYMAASVLGSIGLIPPITILGDAVARINETSESGFTDRTTAWSFAIEKWKDQPLEGYGYAAGPTLFERSRGVGLLNFRGDAVHNSYLQWTLETGMIGFLPLAMLLVAALWCTRRASIERMNCGLVGAVVVGLLVQLGESTMFGTGTAYPLLFWSAVAGAIAAACRPVDNLNPLKLSSGFPAKPSLNAHQPLVAGARWLTPESDPK